MKFLITTLLMSTLIIASGCSWFSHESSQGGIAPVNEEFSISVPGSCNVKQGEKTTATITLNRGDHFKQDIQLTLKADGISVTPKNILVRASENPEVKILVSANPNTALGEYSVSVEGTPTTGRKASIAFSVTVTSE